METIAITDRQRLMNSIASISAMEAEPITQTPEERVRTFVALCRSAHQLERSQRLNNAAPCASIPWPESTYTFLRECMNRLHGH
jgi:hypothetical protein